MLSKKVIASYFASGLLTLILFKERFIEASGVIVFVAPALTFALVASVAILCAGIRVLLDAAAILATMGSSEEYEEKHCSAFLLPPLLEEDELGDDGGDDYDGGGDNDYDGGGGDDDCGGDNNDYDRGGDDYDGGGDYDYDGGGGDYDGGDVDNYDGGGGDYDDEVLVAVVGEEVDDEEGKDELEDDLKAGDGIVITGGKYTGVKGTFLRHCVTKTWVELDGLDKPKCIKSDNVGLLQRKTKPEGSNLRSILGGRGGSRRVRFARTRKNPLESIQTYKLGVDEIREKREVLEAIDSNEEDAWNEWIYDSKSLEGASEECDFSHDKNQELIHPYHFS